MRGGIGCSARVGSGGGGARAAAFAAAVAGVRRVGRVLHRTALTAVVVRVVIFAADGKTSRHVRWRRGLGGRMRGHTAHGTRGTPERGADGHGGRKLAVRCIETGLNEVLALRLCHEWLKLGCCECVDEASLRDDEQQDLGTSKRGELVCLCAAMRLNHHSRRRGQRRNKLASLQSGHDAKRTCLFHDASFSF